MAQRAPTRRLGLRSSGIKNAPFAKEKRKNGLSPTTEMSQGRTATDLITLRSQLHPPSCTSTGHLNFENINFTIFAVIDWNYAAYCKVRDQEVGGSNPLAPTT